MADWSEVHGWFDTGDALALGSLLNCVPTGGLFVNVGTYAGRNLASVAPTILNRGLRVLAVDPWASTPQYYQSPEEWQRTYEYFCGIMREFGLTQNVTAMKRLSVEAAATFRNSSLDMVFIDAEHTHEAVMRDITAWKPIIKRGGILCGHDYGHPLYPGVKAAVDDLLPCAMSLCDVESSVWWAEV